MPIYKYVYFPMCLIAQRVRYSVRDKSIYIYIYICKTTPVDTLFFT